MNKLIIFDLDGTFFDTFDDIYNALSGVIERYNYPMPTKEEAKTFIGDGLRVFLAKSIKMSNPNDVPDNILTEYIDNYAQNIVGGTKPYPGMFELINKIHDNGDKLAVISNKSEHLVKAIYKHFEIDNMFSFLAGGNTFDECKPSPLPILKVAEILGFSDNMKNVYMVGDSDNDVISANVAGAVTIFCTFGYGENLKTPADYLVASADEIYNSIYNK